MFEETKCATLGNFIWHYVWKHWQKIFLVLLQMFEKRKGTVCGNDYCNTSYVLCVETRYFSYFNQDKLCCYPSIKVRVMYYVWKHAIFSYSNQDKLCCFPSIK